MVVMPLLIKAISKCWSMSKYKLRTVLILLLKVISFVNVQVQFMQSTAHSTFELADASPDLQKVYATFITWHSASMI